ncbi:DUF4198 domain-containing protein [Actibacterium mucosum]|nr:DUF4198 domain-containing protein [Actibacterium mucosum]
MFKKASVFLSFALVALPASGHEFWISPEAYQIDPGQSIRADLRVGQDFNGPAYSLIPRNVERFELLTQKSSIAIEGRAGDRPALDFVAPDPGLVIVVHETTNSALSYNEWEKFVTFVTHKAMDTALKDHVTRGIPQTGFRETYRRYAKSLISVGNAAGQDRAVGLRTEIVALANPYTDDVSAGLPVRVLLDGAPRFNAQVEVFAKAPDGSVTVTTQRTNDVGEATIAVQPDHHYLLDAVALEALPNDDPANGPVWHTLWASLTLAIPAEGS